MKKILILSALLLLYMCNHSYGQLSMTYFYTPPLAQATVERLSGVNEYVMTETQFNPLGNSDNSIHFSRYDQAGILQSTTNIDEQGVDDRNVDIVNVGNGKFLLTGYYSPIGSGRIFVSAILVDHKGNIMQQAVIESNFADYPNLYATDAAYDKNLNQFVICGMATFTNNYNPSEPKAAFVLTLDPNLNPLNMMAYDSDPGLGNTLDYDIANRIIITRTGRYYITGSENVNLGFIGMGTRNMLIDPVSLNPLWRNPISTGGNIQTNSVDMIEINNTSGGSEFIVLSNLGGLVIWRIIRIDPGTGTLINPFSETINNAAGYGHSITQGNNSQELVISSLKYRQSKTLGCGNGTHNVSPALATIDISTPLATLLNHVEYYSAVGNITFGGPANNNYITLGDFYSIWNGYPAPCYLNNFADREAPGKPYCVASPIYNPSHVLNTKVLDVDAFTQNGCDDIQCSFAMMQTANVIIVSPQLTNVQMPPVRIASNIKNNVMNFITKMDCGSGYYREEATTGVVSINNNVADGLNIYPNPATSDITIELNATYFNKEIQIALYDITGKQIGILHNGPAKQTTMKFTLPDNITTGIYLLQINGENNKTMIEKLTVTR